MKKKTPKEKKLFLNKIILLRLTPRDTENLKGGGDSYSCETRPPTKPTQKL